MCANMMRRNRDMSGNLDLYFAEMDRLLALDSRYKRPGFTMDGSM